MALGLRGMAWVEGNLALPLLPYANLARSLKAACHVKLHLQNEGISYAALHHTAVLIDSVH